MNQQGRLKTWKEERGFGFIQPDEGGTDVFLHIVDCGELSRPPRAGDTVRYQTIKGRDGRLRAGDVTIVGVTQSSSSKHARRLASKVDKTRHRPATGSKSILRVGLLLAVISISAVGAYQSGLIDRSPSHSVTSTQRQSESASSDARILAAYRNNQSDLQVEGAGTVIRVLPDDNDGSRHQRFILQLNSGHTLLIAHNIDLAPRIRGLHAGDYVAFYGEYEWNAQGGVIHWTHHDPRGRHPHGWLKHQGTVYQ